MNSEDICVKVINWFGNLPLDLRNKGFAKFRIVCDEDINKLLEELV